MKENVFPNMFTKAINALGSNGKILSSGEILKLNDACGKKYDNSCEIYFKKHVLIIGTYGNYDSYKLEVSVNSKNMPMHDTIKEYDIDSFSEEDLEEQIMEVFDNITSYIF